MERNHWATAIPKKVPVNLCQHGTKEHDYFQLVIPFAFNYLMREIWWHLKL